MFQRLQESRCTQARRHSVASSVEHRASRVTITFDSSEEEEEGAPAGQSPSQMEFLDLFKPKFQLPTLAENVGENERPFLLKCDDAEGGGLSFGKSKIVVPNETKQEKRARKEKNKQAIATLRRLPRVVDSRESEFIEDPRRQAGGEYDMKVIREKIREYESNTNLAGTESESFPEITVERVWRSFNSGPILVGVQYSDQHFLYQFDRYLEKISEKISLSAGPDSLYSVSVDIRPPLSRALRIFSFGFYQPRQAFREDLKTDNLCPGSPVSMQFYKKAVTKNLVLNLDGYALTANLEKLSLGHTKSILEYVRKSVAEGAVLGSEKAILLVGDNNEARHAKSRGMMVVRW